MILEITLLNKPVYIDLPQGWVGWLGWLALLGMVLILLGRNILEDRERHSSSQSPENSSKAAWGIFLALLILLPLTSLFLILRLPAGNALPLPGRPEEPHGPAFIIFAALPLVLAAGMMGPFQSAFIGFVSGLFLALWETHSPFTPVEFLLVTVLFQSALQQRYRTLAFRALRVPLITAIGISLLYPFLILYSNAVFATGDLANRLDFALTRVLYESLAAGSEFILAGLFASLVAVSFRRSWGSTGPLQPSPVERRLTGRFLYNLAPLALAVVILLIVSSWIVAGNAARQMLHDRMESSVGVTVQAVPFFMETGQNLIQKIAESLSSDPLLYNGTKAQRINFLENSIRSVPFFRQLVLLDQQKNTLASYPEIDYNQSKPSQEELVGINLAFAGVPFQAYTIPPEEAPNAAQISFIAILNDGTDTASEVLVGRADIDTNPFTQPILSGLKNLDKVDGVGMLLDSDKRIIYATRDMPLMEVYQGQISAQEPIFYEDNAADGTRRFVYYSPAVGIPWAVVMTVPARQAQQLALNIAAPMLGMILLLFLIAAILLRFGLRVITGSLENLALEANRIASGQLDHALKVNGEDEVGQLRRAFEKMRTSLKARLDELNRLLVVSQGVAASLEMEEAVKPVLDSALSTGACSARVILTSAAMPEIEGETPQPNRFGAGPGGQLYSPLDDQILALTRQQDRIVLPNLSRVRLINNVPGVPRPEALLAMALRHDNVHYGALWLAYDRPHQFTDDEIRFLATLAGQTELAATNARLFLNAEIGRQRLASILASTPDPVLVTDHQRRLLLANPAAWHVLGLVGEFSQGQPIDKVITNAELVQILSAGTEEKISAEVILSDRRVYLAMASPVVAGGRRVGRVCVLRDVTYFKELDQLKTDFVATVSHDLRSPLTLIRGYATMLEMVGELNEQQANYARKIVTGVETMTRLVNNLLDLGRIEAGIGLQVEIVPVQDVIDRVVGPMQMQAAQKQIQLTIENPSNMNPLIEADQALLQQALQNLVENSIKYTEPGGKVYVRLLAHEESVVFEVSDTGIGIAPVDQPRLFEKFFRGAQRDARKQQGTGLGLAIVKSIVERHGGKVWVESQLGKGSTFSILVPLRQSKKKS